jgi:hypothetical protein
MCLARFRLIKNYLFMKYDVYYFLKLFLLALLMRNNYTLFIYCMKKFSYICEKKFTLILEFKEKVFI